MATSPNYGWSEPDNTSLVKDGALAMRTLGDAIDTSVWNVGFGQAGKNKIINGDFGIWQRGTSFASLANTAYFADRFAGVWTAGGGTNTFSRQTFTPGAAPVAGYEGLYFARAAVTSGGASTQLGMNTKIENVQTLAGTTATLSFWAKADSARTATVQVYQDFGSGGSSVVLPLNTTQAITTSWVRYSFNITFASISGKTVGTSSFLNAYLYFNTGQASGSAQLDTWGWQLEYGSKATPFQTASGSIAGELALAQRYYYRTTAVGSSFTPFGMGFARDTTTAMIFTSFPVEMRTRPTALEQSGTATDYNILTASVGTNCSAVPAIFSASTTQARTLFTLASGLVAQWGVGGASAQNNTTAYLGWSAEL
jgi:hypothetical protein